MRTLADVVSVLDAAYPPELAEGWDVVGLVCGDPGEEVDTVLLAVDATADVVDEALDLGAQALVVHHPLFLHGVTGVGADTPKGALIHRLIRAGCALFTAHTNADRARPGVSDALADALGLRDLAPLEPEALRWDRIVTTVPDGADAERVREALFAAGAGVLGDYTHAAFSVTGTGQFRPGAGAHPAVGARGRLEHVREERVETIAPRGARADVVAALIAAHPYEEVPYDVLELAPRAGPRGLGRVGALAAPETLREFTDRVADRLPSTAWGTRAAGDPEAMVRTVAVCGGAGDSMLATARRAGVDVLVTADLRHHPVDEHLRLGGPALVDVAHWASEAPWCGQAKGILRERLGGTVAAHVSTLRTDPWRLSTSPESARPSDNACSSESTWRPPE